MNDLLMEFVNNDINRFLSKEEIENYYVSNAKFLDDDKPIMNIVISIKPKDKQLIYNGMIRDYELMKWHKIKIDEYLKFKRLRVINKIRNKIRNRQITNFIINNTKSF